MIWALQLFEDHFNFVAGSSMPSGSGVESEFDASDVSMLAGSELPRKFCVLLLVWNGANRKSRQSHQDETL